MGGFLGGDENSPSNFLFVEYMNSQDADSKYGSYNCSQPTDQKFIVISSFTSANLSFILLAEYSQK